jgi:uncharacterized protein YecE (DUF72 family)
VRFHRGRASPPPSYGRQALRSWAERLGDLWDDTADVYCYFNNDQGACAPRDAQHFARALVRAGRALARPAGDEPAAN